MSEDQSRRMEGTSEIVRNSTHLVGFIGGRLNRDSDIVKSHTKQIESLRNEIEEKDEAISRLNEDVKNIREENDGLKLAMVWKDQEIKALEDKIGKEIEEKNEAISRLNKDVKDLLEENNDLKSSMETKDQEIKALEDKIKKLETEKKVTEKKLRSVEFELEAVKKEVVEMKEANKTSEERNATLKKDVEKLSKKMDGMTKDLDKSIKENTTLKKDVKALREEMQCMASVEVPDRMSFPFLSDPVEKASLILGELCWRVQAMMYQKVFPNSYECKKSYKVKHIDEDIEDLVDEQHKDEAEKRWVALKTKLNWKKKRHTRAMKSIQDSRNVTAHPELDEELLEISAKLMEQEGKLTDWHSPACVRELIEMWKQLTLQPH